NGKAGRCSPPIAALPSLANHGEQQTGENSPNNFLQSDSRACWGRNIPRGSTVYANAGPRYRRMGFLCEVFWYRRPTLALPAGGALGFTAGEARVGGQCS